MSYKFIDHTADVMFEVKCKTLEEVFESAALATFEVQVTLKDVKRTVKKKIKLKNEGIEDLLFDFLEELIYIKDVNSLLFSKFSIKIKENLLEKRSQKKGFVLECVAEGEKINPKKHELKTDVKAPTLHRFKLEKCGNYWRAVVILDI